jgi:spermidine/putrescine transport system permease protein
VSGLETQSAIGALSVIREEDEVSGGGRRGRSTYFRNPWRRPRVLALVTWLYLAWSLLPVAIAILFSFNAGKSRTTWQGFSFRWYWGDPNLSVWHDPSLHHALWQTLVLGVFTTIIAVPLGVAFALGLDRWHGRLPQGWNFTMLMSFVVPEIVLGVSLFFVVTQLTGASGPLPWVPLHAGTVGQIVGLVTFQMSYPVIIVRARLLTIGKQYEEAAADLGASRMNALRRVLFPMLFPAIFASAVLVFADVIDDFVIVQKLSSGGDTESVAVKIYNTARGAPTPALNALATLLLVAAFIAIALGYLGYRALTRGEGQASIGSFAGQV